MVVAGPSLVNQVILLLGNPENRGQDLVGGGRHLGVVEADLTAMADEPIKRRLHLAADCLAVLVSGRYKALIEGLSRREKPPSGRYILVMEAMAILFTPSGTFRSPAKNHSAASWFTIKRCTMPYEAFCDRLRGVDKLAIPGDNLLVLEEYLAQPHWPRAADLVKVRGTSSTTTASSHEGWSSSYFPLFL